MEQLIDFEPQVLVPGDGWAVGTREFWVNEARRHKLNVRQRNRLLCHAWELNLGVVSSDAVPAVIAAALTSTIETAKK